MAPTPVSSLRSVALGVADPAAAEKFFVEVWRLSVSDRADGVVYLRAAGSDHHLVSLHGSDRTALRNITLRTRSLADLQQIEVAGDEGPVRHDRLADRPAFAEPQAAAASPSGTRTDG